MRLLDQSKTAVCLCCGAVISCLRKTKKFCSRKCCTRHRNGYPKSRACLECGAMFKIISKQHDANRKYCTTTCSKRANGRRVKKWIGDHPEAQKNYNKKRIEKNPSEWREKARQERLKAIELLGGCCCVCGVLNPNWLHVDYIPTMRGKGGRHARHLAFVRNHVEDFRLLCANHHYELTQTGKIEGTEITQ